MGFNRTRQHTELVNAARVALDKECHEWLVVWPNEKGLLELFNLKGEKASMSISRRRVGLPDGSGDLVGIAYPGRWVEWEAKTGKAVQEPSQKLREQLVTKFGGYYRVFRSVDEILAQARYLRVMLRAVPR